MRYLIYIIILLFLSIINQYFAKIVKGPDGIPPGYYDGTSGLSGLELKNKLHFIINEHTRRTYSQVREDLKITDEDPNNSNNVILLYKGTSSPKSNFGSDPDNWNREHVWPSSHGFPNQGDTAHTDLHHLRPTDASVNSDRGDKDFNNGGNPHPEAIGNFFDSNSWEARDAVKGDVARMVFYMAVRYEESGNYDLEIADFEGTTGSQLLGVLSTLLEWHSSDPVDQNENDRNDAVYAIQNNRNPFIDHPEFVELIWDDTSSVEPPDSSSLYISEVSDAGDFTAEYIEFYNNSVDTISLQNTKLIRLQESGAYDGYTFDIGIDGSGDEFILPNGLLIISRGANKNDFETNWGVTLSAGVKFNQGTTDLYFGTPSARRWALKEGGTTNSNDGSLIDDTGGSVAGENNRSYQEPIGSWNTESYLNNSTPGELDPDQALPVELVNFTALISPKGIILKWLTETEINNYGFEIQKLRSPLFKIWEKIGFLSGTGNSFNKSKYQFSDQSKLLPGNHFYRLKQIDLNGDFEYSNVVSVEVLSPNSTQLLQNYPNPFNPATIIEFYIENEGNTKLEIFNQIGEKTITLVNKNLQVGQYSFQFDAAKYSTGVYFYRLTTPTIVLNNKMMLVK